MQAADTVARHVLKMNVDVDCHVANATRGFADLPMSIGVGHGRHRVTRESDASDSNHIDPDAGRRLTRGVLDDSSLDCKTRIAGAITDAETRVASSEPRERERGSDEHHRESTRHSP